MARTAERRWVVLDVAARQLGLFTTAQAIEHGMTREAVRAWGRSGGIVRVAPGVWSVAGSPDGGERRAMATVLSRRYRAVLALGSAGWVWRLPGHLLEPVELLSVRRRHQPAIGSAHTSTRFDLTDVTVRHGLPVTTPTRTIFDLAGRQHPERTARDLNTLMGAGLVGLGQLQAQLDRLAGKGRPGITVMRDLIGRLEGGEAPTESGLELRCRDILAEAGFVGLAQQVVLGDDDGVVARVDFCDRALRIVIEVDSDRYHRGLLDSALDASKTARLEAIGWTVVRITEHEIFWGRAALVLRLERVRAAARRLHPADR